MDTVGEGLQAKTAADGLQRDSGMKGDRQDKWLCGCGDKRKNVIWISLRVFKYISLQIV